MHERLYVLQKNSIAILCITAIARCAWWRQLQSAQIIHWLAWSLNQLQSAWIVYQWVYCWIDCNQLGSCINGCRQWVQRWVRCWVQWWVRRWVWWWDQWLVPLCCAGLSTSAKRLTAQTRGFHGYQPRGFIGLVDKRTRRFRDSLMAISQKGVKAL